MIMGIELQNIPLADLEPHPLNPNVITPDLQQKLAANIQRSGRYPPLIVRPLDSGRYQLLDGEQRLRVLLDLGETHAWCVPWPCDDAEALILLATLNRLEGEDVVGRRAALIAELAAHESLAQLARLLPEEEAQLEQQLASLDRDIDAEIARLTEHADKAANELPALFSFAVPREHADLVEDAVETAAARVEGRDRRGLALVALARAYLTQERADD